MANVTETGTTFPAGIYQLETTDKPIGGAAGIANMQAQQLADRTKFLYTRSVRAFTTKTANYTLLTSDVGKAVLVTPASSGVTISMPLSTACVAGDVFEIINAGSSIYSITILPQISDTFAFIQEMGVGFSMLTLEPGETARIGLSTGINGWNVLSRFWTSRPPVGEIVAMPITAVPQGFVKCNGAAISRSTYANLFAKIGTSFGSGNGTSTFNVPDLRAEMLRGYDDGRGVDTGRLIGSNQSQFVAASGTGAVGYPRNVAVQFVIRYQ